MKKQYFLIIDTETTQDNLVADFGAVIVDKKGKIYSSISVLIDGIFTDYEAHPLFFDPASQNGIWSKKSRERRYANYERHIENGTRMIASVAAINRWLVRAKLTYPNIIWTAYNSAFDLNKCENTGIDLSVFDFTFCLWQAAYTQFAHTKKYRNFALMVHAFNPPTKWGNMTYKTNAETMTRFVLDDPEMADEPHTSIEDVIGYELPILLKLLNVRSAKWLLEAPKAYNWRACQVRDNFTSI
jgi:hypothetical protein